MAQRIIPLIELQYLPSAEYLALFFLSKRVYLEAHEHYQKQTFRNRARILTPNGVDTLVVPVLGGGGQPGTGNPIVEVQPDYKQKWQNRHWRALKSAYQAAPFFDYYAKGLQEALYTEWSSLWQLNEHLLTFCLRAVEAPAQPCHTGTYHASPSEAAKSGLYDLREAIHPKKPSLQSAPPAYQQVFGSKFVSGMCAAELLCCLGPEAHRHLQQYATQLAQNLAVQ